MSDDRKSRWFIGLQARGEYNTRGRVFGYECLQNKRAIQISPEWMHGSRSPETLFFEDFKESLREEDGVDCGFSDYSKLAANPGF